MRRFVLLAFALVGCRHELAQPWCVEDPSDPRCLETAAGADTGVADANDADVDAPETDASPPSCADAGPATEPCGKCGTRTRTCIADGTWSEWGSCEGEGVCSPDEVETLTAACPGALEKRTRRCSASCAWEADACALPKGWTAIAEPPAGFGGRNTTSAIWTGGEMILYGGNESETGPGRKDGAIYSVAKNTWTPLPTPAFAVPGRKDHAAVWDGFRDMYVWGGRDTSDYLADGLIFDATTKSWQPMPAAPLAARYLHGAVWSPVTSELIVWGGGGAGNTRLADGAAFDANTHTWSTLPPSPLSPRQAHVMLWTGSEVLVWGGADGSTRHTDGALYDPVKKSWRLLPSSGKAARLLPHAGASTNEFIFFGGFAETIPHDGALLTLGSTLAWSDVPVPAASVLSPRLAQSWFGDGRLTVWSGVDSTNEFLENGAVFDLATRTWSSLDVTGAPVPRLGATTVSTEWGAVVWSGYGKPGGGIIELLTSGAIYVH